MNQVMLYEELSMNAHPALKTQLYDGWLLRFSDGYTKRANSVNPIYPSLLTLEDKIAYCEKVYTSLQLPTVYKLTHELSDTLDKTLEHKGYGIVTPTNIMIKELAGSNHQSADFVASNRVTDDWTQTYFTLNGLTDWQKRNTAESMLRNIQNVTLCGSIIKDNQTIACGLCVIERGHAGLFDIVVDRAYRGQGYGFEICASLLSEAKKYHANMAYLQVEQSNLAALGLYSKLGFSNLYEYWYRVKSS